MDLSLLNTHSPDRVRAHTHTHRPDTVKEMPANLRWVAKNPPFHYTCAKMPQRSKAGGMWCPIRSGGGTDHVQYCKIMREQEGYDTSKVDINTVTPVRMALLPKRVIEIDE